jgi:energy-coupling factor transport system ATP-binding protein
MPFVLSKLCLALGLALGFLLFRLLYALVFTGASAGSTLIPLPGLRLSGVFDHVVLFGSIGDLGIQLALQGALPFSAAILGFGLLSIWLTPNKIINFAASSKSGLVGALSIGLATLPSLLDAARRIASANKMRSERKSQILIPLLETAIEKAVTVGIRFATAPRQSTALTKSVLLKHKDFELEMVPGDVIVISGATGSGKTTLLETLIGVNQLRTGRDSSAEVSVFGHDPAKNPAAASGLIGYVPQQPRTWFVSELVEQELIGPALPWITFGSGRLSQLSEGQAVKLAISNALAHNPKLLVLDEPFAALDTESQAELNALLRGLADGGTIVVIAEHQLESIDQPAARWFQLGEILLPGRYEPSGLFAPRKLAVVGRELLLDYSVPKIRDLELPARLQIHQGQRIALLGPNGIGKTSLLTQLAADYPSARMVPERVEDFFVCQSLSEELVRADKVAKVPKGFTRLTFESLVPLDEELLKTHPRDLSAGTKLALALSMQLSFKPQLLLVDEPVKGLDPLARERAAEVLACVAETGCAIVFATHDETFASSADTRVELSAVRQ